MSNLLMSMINIIRASKILMGAAMTGITELPRAAHGGCAEDMRAWLSPMSQISPARKGKFSGGHTCEDETLNSLMLS